MRMRECSAIQGKYFLACRFPFPPMRALAKKATPRVIKKTICGKSVKPGAKRQVVRPAVARTTLEFRKKTGDSPDCVNRTMHPDH